MNKETIEKLAKDFICDYIPEFHDINAMSVQTWLHNNIHKYTDQDIEFHWFNQILDQVQKLIEQKKNQESESDSKSVAELVAEYKDTISFYSMQLNTDRFACLGRERLNALIDQYKKVIRDLENLRFTRRKQELIDFANFAVLNNLRFKDISSETIDFQSMLDEFLKLNE